MHPDIFGLVLRGGRSTRMGMDKALLNYHGLPQRTYQFNLLQKFCSQVFTSCRRDQQVPEWLNPLYDQFYFNGPMNGILSAFTFHPEKSWLVIAVDMPFVDENALHTLVKNHDRHKVATCFINDADKLPEPLLTLYLPAAYPLMLKFIKNRNESPRDFLRTHAIHGLSAPAQKTLLNINFRHQIHGEKSLSNVFTSLNNNGLPLLKLEDQPSASG